MSKTIISIERVNSVEPHPNADRLDVIQVLGYKVVTGKGNFQVGDLAVYFPPDILLPPDVAEEMNVTNYLKHAVFPGDKEKTQCRVGAARLRGVASHGFCSPTKTSDSRIVAGTEIGTDVTALYGAHKYVAPVREGAGDAEAEVPGFHQYTDIENIQRYPNVFEPGEPVVVTEKLHGTNCRLGLICEGKDMSTFCAGSHRVRRKEGPGLYWKFMDKCMRGMLVNLHINEFWGPKSRDVVVFGEIFGPGVQDMDYGLQDKEIRVFDISLAGTYLDHGMIERICKGAGIKTVPVLYEGPFDAELIEEYTYGKTTFDGVKCAFKGREGCVIRPKTEQFSDVLGGRKILKSVSADYRDRKGAKDIE